MRFRLDAPHTLPGDIYLEAGKEIGDDTAYPLQEEFVPSRHMTPLDDEAQELVDSREERPDPLGDAALPTKMTPERVQEGPTPESKTPTTKNSLPETATDRFDLSQPKVGENLSGSKDSAPAKKK